MAIAKLVSESHVQGLSAARHKHLIAKSDNELEAAQSFLSQVFEVDRISQEAFTDILGMLGIRYGGFIMGIGAKTFEAVDYQDSGHIVQLLLREVQKRSWRRCWATCQFACRPQTWLSLSDPRGIRCSEKNSCTKTSRHCFHG